MPDWTLPLTPARMKPWPWLHPKATAYLESLLWPEMEVLEHGSGGSTLWFAERVKHVTAVESKPEWYEALKKRIPDNVALIFGGGVLRIAPVDLLLIDGEPVCERRLWIDASAELVKPGGYVVLDNANRPEYAMARMKFAERAERINIVDGNGGGREFIITEFYRLPL